MPQQPSRGGGLLHPRPIGIGALVGVTAAALLALVLLQRDTPATAERSPSSSSDASPPAGEADEIGDAFGRAFSASDTTCSGLLECVKLSLPVDHADPESDESIDVRFGRHAAEGEREGVLVVATGGPGSSGLTLVETYLDLLPSAVVRRYDIVFFAQRGVEGRLGAGCEDAELGMPGWADLAALDPADAERQARDWVDECLDEAGVTVAELDRYATFQAAADLDAYLDHIDAGQVVIFGESYGTHFAQVYAAHRPERVAGLILDGVVDPHLSPVAQALEQAEGFGDVLSQVLEACGEDILCADDFPDGAAEAWDALADRLSGGPVEVELPSHDGRTLPVDLSLDDFVLTTALMMYTEYDRAMFLRGLASAARGDLRPLVRLAALIRGTDPENGEAVGPWIDSGIPYYAIHCQSYPVVGVQPLRDLYTEVRRVQGDSRMSELAYHDLPCLAGFAGIAEPAALPDVEPGAYPALILTSTADPATPTWWAESIAERLPHAHLVVTNGGSHGSFGWGSPCTDDLVKEFLVFGDLPDEQRTECDGWVLDPYIPLPLGGPSAYSDVLDALVAVEEAILYSPDYVYWETTPWRLGCAHGGWMEMSDNFDDEERFNLHECELLPDWPLSGTIIFGYDFSSTMSLTLPNGTLEYESTEMWEVTVSGVIDGRPIDLSRQVTRPLGR